ncbi:hypothetical protein BU14_0058s0028 [Porphyra umbilicalis]|uniref:Uncharacterized protein n=1 Tax=Porphyra umbilicalis TaxID=2786 RepID=A0A1X6PGY0_PORUM|nr:hypothetical protein BU14_0058s0028 [Porphyra umbilicalis]|eukprot:OSX80117.1 hypothetical protein BU14_0058s0028 [Porphyra umbilicalis]
MATAADAAVDAPPPPPPSPPSPRPPPPTDAAAASAYEMRVRVAPLPPLHEAARAGSATSVAARLRAGDVVTAATDWGDTALHWAAAGGHVGVLRQLLDAGADVAAASIFG